MSVSVGFISLGCAKNLVDSQILAGYLKAGKFTLAPAPEVADIIVINTCAFINEAREEAAENILAACEHKRQGRCLAVIVAGCMVARYRGQMKRAFPEVDAFLGVDDLERIAEIAKSVAAGKRRGVVVSNRGLPRKLYNPTYAALRFTGEAFAYLKVAEGCDHRCAYCAIPLIRGQFRSRPVRDLLRETRGLLASGVKELNLIAQDVLRYGCDLSADGRSKLPDLMRRIDAMEGDFRFRLLYGYPSAVTDAVLEILATGRHACRYLDIPIQHSHPDILRAMNRPAAVAATADLPERLRRAVPGIVLRTTCLVGFPGETDAHFNHLAEYIKAARFDHLGVFVFSPEEGTAAYDLPDRPPAEVAESRRKKLMEIQRKIVREKLAALRGTADTALLLAAKGKEWIGRLSRQAPDVDGITRIRGVPETARPGDFIPLTLTGSRGYDLLADARKTGANER